MDPYKAMIKSMYGMIAFCIYVVYFMCLTLPPGGQPSTLTVIHVGIVILAQELIKIANLTVYYAIFFKVAD